MKAQELNRQIASELFNGFLLLSNVCFSVAFVALVVRFWLFLFARLSRISFCYSMLRLLQSLCHMLL